MPEKTPCVKRDTDKTEEPPAAVPDFSSKFFPEYGVAFHEYAHILPGLRKTFLNVRVQLPMETPITEFDPPSARHCAEHNVLILNGTGIEPMVEMCEQAVKIVNGYHLEYRVLTSDINDMIRQKFKHFLPINIMQL